MTNLLETFEMRIENEDNGKVIISMPVTDKVKQPSVIYMVGRV